MSSISEALINTIREIQELSSLRRFTLGGGTNLALRYNHRQSIDIDLFCPEIIGKEGYEHTVKEVKELYGEKLFGCDYPCDEDDQFMFLRFFVQKEETAIKVEVLQNFKTLEEPEIIDGIRILSEKDIGLFKLMSASNRASNKDIYDLDYLTENISLEDLINSLKKKQQSFNEKIDLTIFDLDGEESPVNSPELLLKFDMYSKPKTGRPSHTYDRIDIMPNNKSWLLARSSWRKKVRKLYENMGLKFPSARGFDIE